MFLTDLILFLKRKEKSIICDENEEEEFEIETKEGSDEIKIGLTYTQFDGEIRVSVRLRLSKVKAEMNCYKIEFLKEEGDNRLVSYQLINALKQEFEYLREVQ